MKTAAFCALYSNDIPANTVYQTCQLIFFSWNLLWFIHKFSYTSVWNESYWLMSKCVVSKNLQKKKPPKKLAPRLKVLWKTWLSGPQKIPYSDFHSRKLLIHHRALVLLWLPLVAAKSKYCSLKLISLFSSDWQHHINGLIIQMASKTFM